MSFDFIAIDGPIGGIHEEVAERTTRFIKNRANWVLHRTYQSYKSRFSSSVLVYANQNELAELEKCLKSTPVLRTVLAGDAVTLMFYSIRKKHISMGKSAYIFDSFVNTTIQKRATNPASLRFFINQPLKQVVDYAMKTLKLDKSCERAIKLKYKKSEMLVPVLRKAGWKIIESGEVGREISTMGATRKILEEIKEST